MDSHRDSECFTDLTHPRPSWFVPEPYSLRYDSSNKEKDLPSKDIHMAGSLYIIPSRGMIDGSSSLIPAPLPEISVRNESGFSTPRDKPNLTLAPC